MDSAREMEIKTSGIWPNRSRNRLLFVVKAWDCVSKCLSCYGREENLSSFPCLSHWEGDCAAKTAGVSQPARGISLLQPALADSPQLSQERPNFTWDHIYSVLCDLGCSCCLLQTCGWINARSIFFFFFHKIVLHLFKQLLLKDKQTQTWFESCRHVGRSVHWAGKLLGRCETRRSNGWTRGLRLWEGAQSRICYLRGLLHLTCSVTRANRLQLGNISYNETLSEKCYDFNT